MIPTGEDGIDHINIYSKGKTKLGRWLSNFTYTPFELKDYGKFTSIEGLWGWLKSEDDFFRYLDGISAKKQAKKIVNPIQRDDFNEIIKKGIDAKLKTYPKKLNDFKYSKLLFAHYYVRNGEKVDAGHEWIVEHFELRRKQLKNFYGIH